MLTKEEIAATLAHRQELQLHYGKPCVDAAVELAMSVGLAALARKAGMLKEDVESSIGEQAVLEASAACLSGGFSPMALKECVDLLREHARSIVVERQVAEEFPEESPDA